MDHTFLFYDFETFGVDPARDWPCQFAGIRTDKDFNEIGEPVNIYCRLPDDQLPHPEACLITGITPQKANNNGICEADFIARIHQEFSQPNTCVLGYNTIRFDDEVTRYSLYRNFFDPYARERMNGCSRWDLIDVVRTCEALRPEGINWPKREDGTPSFKLEHLSQANGITHIDAHDALSDVRATIALARLLKEKQPRLFDHLFEPRHKHNAAKLLDTYSSQPKPVVHISGMFPAAQHCAAVMLPVAPHPRNKNEVIAVNLSADIEPLLTLSADDIRTRLFSSNAELQEQGLERIPVKTVRLNRCPVVLPWGIMVGDNRERLGIDEQACVHSRERLLEQLHGLRSKLGQVYAERKFPATEDPDQQLYGGFFSYEDQRYIGQVRSTPPEQLISLSLPFKEDRLVEMLFRYRARNWPELLSPEDQQQWLQHRQQRLNYGCGGNSLTLESYQDRLRQLLEDTQGGHEQTILRELVSYGQQLAEGL